MEKFPQLLPLIRTFFTKGHARSIRAKQHIFASLFIKGFRIFIGFLLVPLTIEFVGKTEFGYWSTLGSIVTWFAFFDIGLGKGLRNRFAEALSRGDTQQARIYVSTSYFVLGLISLTLLGAFLLVNPLLDWAGLIKAEASLAKELTLVMLIVFSFFCLNFIFKLITNLIMAEQQTAWVGVLDLASAALSLVIIWVLSITTEGSLVYLAWAMAGAPMILYGVVTIVLFATRYRQYAPTFRYVDMHYLQDLASLGVQFFVIQVIGVIIFQTDKVIISRLFSGEAVTSYHVAFQYFSLITKVFAIITLPMWSAFTEAYEKKEYEWIRNSMKKLMRMWGLMAVGGVLLLGLSDFAYSIWVGGQGVVVPFGLSAGMCLYVVTLAFGTPYVIFMNGVSKIRLQLLVSSIGGVINIPLSIFLARDMGLGSVGVILASTICVSYGFLVAPIQYQRIITLRARGIWNK